MGNWSCLSRSAGLIALAFSSTCFGQVNIERVDRTIEQIQRDLQTRMEANVPLGQRTLVDYGAYLTASYLSADDPQLENHGLRSYDLVAYGRINLDDRHEAYVRGRLYYQDFNPGDVTGSQSSGLHGKLEEGYYRFNWQAKPVADAAGSRSRLSVQAGRQFVPWGTGLVFEDYLDGVDFHFEAHGLELQILAGGTPPATIYFARSRPDFDVETYRGFFGAMLSGQFGRHRPFIYFLDQRNFNPDDTLSIGLIQTRFEYNSYYIGAGSTGAISD